MPLPPSSPYWEIPELTSVRKLPPRATFTSFPDARSARTRDPSRCGWWRSLDGNWSFRLAPDPQTAERWRSGDLHDAPAEATIEVPGNWELQGHGRPHYTNIQMPFPEEPPRVPAANPTGLYRRGFAVPAEWAGRRIVLRFGSAESVLSVYVNGVFVGLSKDSRLPAEFEVTDAARVGEDNEVVAVVVKWSDASFLEDQDMWWLAGLARSVELFATPLTFIADVFARPEPNAACTEAELELVVDVGYAGALHADAVSVEARMFDPKGRPVFPRPLKSEVSTRRSPFHELRKQVVLRAPVPRSRLRLWSAERPELYLVQITLRSPDGVSHTALRVGFRRIEVRERNLLINGRRVLIAGANRHESDDVRGRALTYEHMRRDAVLMKRFNINAVRSSHYPTDPRWLELCDELGLYVIDEANIETHALSELCSDTRYATAWLDRAMRMVVRDKNHPSVIVWSLGNESGYGPNHDAAAGWIRNYDPSRPLHYQGAISRAQSGLTYAHGSAASDLICPMYDSLADLKAWCAFAQKAAPMERTDRRALSASLIRAAQKALPPGRHTRHPMPPLQPPLHPFDRPLILCEYSASVGNSNGSLRDYFTLFRTLPGLQGGFIWEWCDHGLKQRAANGREHWAYGGDFGDEPNDANFVCDGVVWPDRTPHAALFEHKYLAQPVAIEASDAKRGRVRIVNRQDFLSLGWLRGEWELLLDGARVRRGRLPRLDLEPGAAREISIAFGEIPPDAEAHLTLLFRTTAGTAWAPRGHEVAREQFLVQPRTIRPTRVDGGRTRRNPQPAALETLASGGIALRAGDIRAEFHRETGLVSLRLGERECLHAPTRLSLWRAPTDNDGLKLWAGQEKKPLGRWRALGLDRLQTRALGFASRRERSGAVVVTLRHAASGRGEWRDAVHSQRYSLHPDGALVVDHEVALGGADMTDLPRVGVEWSLIPGFERLRYFGRGPNENYADRKSAELLGIYRTTVTDNYAPYIVPQENGHHTDTRWLELAHDDGPALRVEGAPTFEFNVSHFSEADLFAARHTSDLNPRPETILHVDVAHRGLGTGACGPDTLPEYRVTRRRYAWRTILRLLPERAAEADA